MNVSEKNVREIVLRARAYDAKEDVADPSGDPESSEEVDILRSRPSDVDRSELVDEIESLDEDAQAELVALYWIGRGDIDAGEFPAAVAEAKTRRTAPTGQYLVGSALLGDYLEAGLDAVIEAGVADET